jgi:DNA-binding winged helix-turn-helix (wHTH) protein
MGRNSKHFYEFGEFRLGPSEKQLRRNAEVIPLTPKALGVLLLFVRNGGHLFEKEDFMRQVWPGTIVEEKNVADNAVLPFKQLSATSGDDYYLGPGLADALITKLPV